MPNTKSKPYVSGDVFIREGLPREYDTESVSVSNGTGAAYDLKAGQFMTAAAPTLVAGIAAKNNAIPETKPIRKLCEQFLTGTLAMMHDRKRPKLTFNNLWDKILGVFKEHRWASVATKRLEKYEVGSVYRYDELFNYCPDMECFDGFKLE
jgi:hypothetical protein